MTTQQMLKKLQSSMTRRVTVSTECGSENAYQETFNDEV